MKQSLKERLVKYLSKVGDFVASGELQRIVAEKTSYTPRTTCRRLEELVVGGRLDVEYRKGHAWYKALPQRNLQKEMELYWNSL